MHSPLYPCCLVTEIRSSIVLRVLTNLPSQYRREIEFIRPLVEERLAKMEEYGDDWDDKPVCQVIMYLLFLSLNGQFTERYANVAHE